MTDLTAFDVRAASEAGAEFEVVHPATGEGTGLFLSVLGYDSAAVEAAGRDVARAAMSASQKKDVNELMQARRVAQAQAAVTKVRGGSGSTETIDGVRAFMAQPGGIFVVDQVEAFAGNRASFFKSAETP